MNAVLFMGYVFAEIELSNAAQPDLAPIHVKALVDTVSLMLCIPEYIAVQLNLSADSLRDVIVADGRNIKVPYVGPIRVNFQKRSCFVGALVMKYCWALFPLKIWI